MIDWVALITVFLAALIGALAFVVAFSCGIRLLSVPSRADAATAKRGKQPARDDEMDDVNRTGRPRIATLGAYACFVASGCIVVYALYLIFPYWH